MNTYAILFAVLLAVLFALVFLFPKTPATFPVPVQAQAKPVVGVPIGPSNVRDLKSADEAREFIKHKGMLAVYATWCGHCKAMMPALEEASMKTAVPIGRLEATFAGDFAAQQEIRGFPTLLVSTDAGVVTRHQGGRDTASLLAALA